MTDLVLALYAEGPTDNRFIGSIWFGQARLVPCSPLLLPLVCRLLGFMVYRCGMYEQSLAKRVGALIRQLRIEKGMSQEALAERCGLHRTYVGCVERGEKMITIETASKVVFSLDTTLSQFFARLESETTPNDHNAR